MSNHSVLKDLKIRQSNPWYFYRYKNHTPLLKSEINIHSSNMHLIAANKNIGKQLKSVRKGEIVNIKWYLVNVTGDKVWR